MASASTDARPAPPSSPPSPSSRSLLIDVVRGAAIVLVTLGHTNQGTLRRQYWGDSPIGHDLNSFIYAFHMPAFFFVSGIFLCNSVRKRGAWRFTLEKLRTLAYPYLLWACIYGLTPLILAKYTVTPPFTWHEFLLATATGGISWFLPTIFFVVIAGMLLRHIPMPLLFLITIVVSYIWPVTGLEFVDRGFKHLPFLVAGMWVGRNYEQIERIPKLAAAAAALVIALVIGFATHGPLGAPDSLFILLGLLGTLMLLLVARCLDHSLPARQLAWIGVASLGIFLVSPYPQGLGRQILLAFHIVNPWMQVLFPTLLTTVIAAILYQKRVKLHIAWLFAWPFA